MEASGTLICVILPLLAIAGIIAYRVSVNRRQAAAHAASEAELRRLKRRYDDALSDLRTDATKRQIALDAGRAYSAFTRRSSGGAVTVYDEMALMNDINAAAAQAPQPASLAPAASTGNTAERLRKLEDLKAQGLISEDEYQARRATILDDV